MTKDVPSWLGEEVDEAPSRPAPTRRWALLSFAALPWLVVAGLLVSGALPGRTTEPTTGATTAVGEPASSADPAEHEPRRETPPDPAANDTGRGEDAEEGPDRAEPGAGIPAAGTSADPLHREIAALATVVARAWLTDVGPRLHIEGVDARDDRYLEQATVETIDVRGEVAVATLLAVVLERDGDRYTDVSLRRLAVPVGLTPSGPRPTGPPWWLPDPDLQPRPPLLDVLDDPELGLATAERLTGAGYQDVEIERLSRHEDGWLVADVVARLSGDRDVRGPVWLPQGENGPGQVGDPGFEAHHPTHDHHVPDEHSEEQP
jgi:hypothetical protein